MSIEITPELVAEHGLSDEEYARCKRICGDREPTWPELGIFSVMWSEHCSYKSTRIHLKRLPTEGPTVLIGPGENAGVVDIGDGMAACFKMESHNHPSFIEPYQGAATGVGGIMRDIFTMGARPIASLNSLRFGPPDHPRTKHLLTGVVAGIGGYGNCMGVPTVGGEVQFHESYAGNILVNAFNLGLVQADRIFLGQATGVGNPVIYAGAKTGRDGIHGATMASDSFDDEALEKRPTVQVGDPFTEKRVLEACLELFEANLVLGIQDMGAAGLTCSTFEMAGRAGTGIDLDLDRVPRRETGMTAYEVLLSESQERMLMVCAPENVDAFEGETVVDLPAAPLADEAPVYDRPQTPADLAARQAWDGEATWNPSDLLTILGSPNIASRRFVWRQYDHMVRLGTRLGPGGDAALVRVLGTDKALGMTVDCNSRHVWLDPKNGAAMAIAEAVRNLACVGCAPLGGTDCLNFGNPEKPEIMWEIATSIDGMAEACRALGVPITGGNCSLYNETDDAGILPTPTVGVVGLREMPEGAANPSPVFVETGHVIAIVGQNRGETLGGSEWLYTLHGQTAGVPPVCDLAAEKATSDAVRTLVADGLVNSAHDVSDGGLLTALAECAACHYGRRIGATVEDATVTLNDDEPVALATFGEGGARVVISYPKERRAAIEAVCAAAGAPITPIGTTGGDALSVGDASWPLEALFEAWDAGLETHIGVSA